MLNFPDHQGSLTLEHNDHLNSYVTVQQEIDDSERRHRTMSAYADKNWVSLEEKGKAIETNELWSFLWHDSDPVRRFSAKHASTLEALMTGVGFVYTPIVFPRHKASLSLIHNQHRSNYDNVKEEIIDSYNDYYSDDSWISLEEKQQALDTNQLWTLHWYPDTPVGFCLLHASTLEAIMTYLDNNKDLL